jgi:hypothetical protein
MIPKSGHRFPAFANRLRPKADFGGQEPASAGEGRPDKIMLKKAKKIVESDY